jgi:hypothetical protein
MWHIFTPLAIYCALTGAAIGYVCAEYFDYEWLLATSVGWMVGWLCAFLWWWYELRFQKGSDTYRAVMWMSLLLSLTVLMWHILAPQQRTMVTFVWWCATLWAPLCIHLGYQIGSEASKPDVSGV